MKAYIVSVFVCILLFFNINVPFCAASRKGSASRDGWRSKIGDDARDPGLGPSLGGSCQFQERAIVDVEENKIIRTKDSIDKGACFADAIVVRSIDECSDKCCSYSGGCNAQCDTTIFVHEPEDEVNCFLFVCGNGHGKCEFSHHTGYTTTKLSNRRKKIDSHVDKPLTTLTAFQQTSTYPPPTTTRKALPMLTTQTLATTKEEEISRQGPPQKEMPEDTKISGCEHHQFQCADSGECFVFEYVCDGIIDCKDNSDETDCGGYDLYQPLSINDDYDNIASFDDEINDDTDDYTTTKQSTSAYEVEKTTVKPMTTKSIVSPTNKSFTEISGNITASPKKTVANNSNNKNGSSHSTLFKKKSSVPDKSLTSAILPLAFGLLITVLLLLLVGCRLRQVNRRLRYGRLKTNVAEADYLINGMYL